MPAEWFEEWFDSEYYHLLYKTRDYKEAELFINKLFEFLNPAPGALALDLACGKGRHSLYLNQKGLNVTGYDLSPHNIQAASVSQNPTLHFEVRDMRLNLGNQKFDYIFNLFTSFGYFDDDAENNLVLSNIAEALKPGGFFIFDYLNEKYVLDRLSPGKDFFSGKVHFKTYKLHEGCNVIKHIEVDDQGCVSHFKEQVRLISKQNFEQVFEKIGLEKWAVFGDYDLSPFLMESSPRLIFILKNK